MQIKQYLYVGGLGVYIYILTCMAGDENSEEGREIASVLQHHKMVTFTAESTMCKTDNL